MRSEAVRNSKVSGKNETSLGYYTQFCVPAGKSWSLEELESQKEPIPLPRRKIFKWWPDVGKEVNPLSYKFVSHSQLTDLAVLQKNAAALRA